MPEILDLFNSDPFSWISLTARVNAMPFAPMRAGRLGVFEEAGIPTTFVAIEEMGGILSLIPASPRGGPGYENARNRAKLRLLTVPHFELNDSVFPDEVQNRREFDGTGLIGSAQAVVDQRFAEMNPKHDATTEYGRIGAIKGLFLDADGSTLIYNWFTEFGVTQQTVDFTLGTTTASMLGKIQAVKAATEDVLGAATYDHIHCFAGATWFQRFTEHESVTKAFTLWQQGGQLGAFLRTDLRYQGFDFGGVIFEEYRGNVGGIPFVAASEAHFFPVGVPGLFLTRFAPADYMETVNTPGLPRYAKQWPDPNGNRHIRLNTQSNPLSFCTRPRVLVKATTSN